MAKVTVKDKVVDSKSENNKAVWQQSTEEIIEKPKEQLLSIEHLESDVLIIGGGTAGCYAAYTLQKSKDINVIIAEKANIKRSGCLAAGVNAINAYITPGRKPSDYVDYAMKDAKGIAREDLLLSMSERLNSVTRVLEDLGLVIQKDENGEYVSRGNRNIKINGENLKPLLSKALGGLQNVAILNHVNITDLLIDEGRAYGAVGFSVRERKVYIIHAHAVLMASGGASGLYKPNNPGFSRHKMWYPPFNTGAGYAMGLKSGAEMTTFEMRFIALRCKDTIAPTGTIAQGAHAAQINGRGEDYGVKYGYTTSDRVYGTVTENERGRGPCFLKTKGIDKEAEEELLKAYLNMAPQQTLKWLESGRTPSVFDVEIEGTEPYVVGGHTASGYWVDEGRRTTLDGLYAAGDVAGGCPQKYVTGALAEGEIAAESILFDLLALKKDGKAESTRDRKSNSAEQSDESEKTIIGDYLRILNAAIGSRAEATPNRYSAEELLEAMQKAMDTYAGGISTNYRFNENGLRRAGEELTRIEGLAEYLKAESMQELMYVYELKERLLVCRALLAHLMARKETRWHSFCENTDYPDTAPAFQKFVNSIYRDGKIEIILRSLEGSAFRRTEE